MRALCLLAILPSLAACEPEPVPQPEPPEPRPDVVQREIERAGHLSDAVRPGDFKANFGEPFVQFENRGSKMAVSQSYEPPNYRVVDVARSSDGEAWVFRADEGAIPGGEPFVLTIERKPCSSDFAAESTGFTAWLGTEADPRQARSCAAPAR